uniref:BY PROTMAP: gi/342319584/gb/EGU11531.1/ Proteophosphoglycan 5 [Rhodotorula glutinis ATCC 204091] n=1 Tax=Rhodotorula toruloides TaxID=5286 RepID=A0A0K3CEC8_RHOTO
MLFNSAGASDDTTPALPSTNEAPAAGSPPGQLELQDAPAGTVRRPTGLLDLPDELLTVIWEAVLAYQRPHIGLLLLNKRVTEVILPTCWRMLILDGDMATLDHKLDFVLNRPSARRHIQSLVFSPINVLHPVRLAVAAATQLESLTEIVISLVEESTSHPVCHYAEILATLPRLDRLWMMVHGDADWFLDGTHSHLEVITFKQRAGGHIPLLPWPNLRELQQLEVHFSSCLHESINGIWAGLSSLQQQGTVSGLKLDSLHIFFGDDPDAASEDGSSLSDCFYQQLFSILKDLRLRDLAVSETTRAHWSFLAGLEPLTTVTSLYYEALPDENSDTFRRTSLRCKRELKNSQAAIRHWSPSWLTSNVLRFES